MNTKLFLDLEETLVESWFNPTLLHGKINIIKEFIKENNIKEASLFSLAVTDQKELEAFNRCLKPILEQTLNIDLSVTLINDCLDLLKKKHCLFIQNNTEWNDILVFNMKEQIFTEWIKTLDETDTNFILFDDIVEDMDISFKKTNNTISFKRI